nr:hypothetical protein [Tanacetum cinerariifolium]
MKMKKMRGDDSDEEKVCEDEVFNGGAFAGFAVFRRGGGGEEGVTVGGERHWSDLISMTVDFRWWWSPLTDFSWSIATCATRILAVKMVGVFAVKHPCRAKIYISMM